MVPDSDKPGPPQHSGDPQGPGSIHEPGQKLWGEGRG